MNKIKIPFKRARAEEIINDKTKSSNLTGTTKRIANFFERSLKNNPIARDVIDNGLNPYQLMSDHLNYSEIKDIVSATGLRVRLFVATQSCDNWSFKTETMNFFSSLNSVDFFNESHQEVIDQLRNSKFISYASVVIIVHCISYLISILEAVEQNQYLLYKSKFILCRHERNFTYPARLLQTCPRQRIQTKLKEIEFIVKQADRFIKGASAIILKNHNDIDEVKNSSPNCQIDNLLLLHWMEEDEFTARHGYACVLYATLLQPYDPLKKTLRESFKHLLATPNADLYCYSINPALAIIINNYYFTSSHGIREGSELDVIQLIRELKIAAIPYILVEDCNQQELLEILDYVENKDFCHLKSLLLFIMSHGDSDDIIYTYDGQLNIKEDILKRIQANKSLENTKVHLAINACRGTIDMEYADRKDLKEIQPTDGSHLKENIILMYSVPNRVQSLRSPETGCPFVQSFCQHFRHIRPTDDVRVLVEKIDADLQEMDYFYGRENCMELVVRDATQQHHIIQIPMNVLNLWKLFKSISDDFPRQERRLLTGDGGSSFICGILNAEKFPKEAFIRRYFSDELEWDTFNIADIS